MDYKNLWMARKLLVGLYQASQIEKDFLTIMTNEALKEVDKLVLVDLGCGDGRLSSCTDLSKFSKIILSDQESVVYEAKDRLLKLKNSCQIICIENFLNKDNVQIPSNSLVLCCGLISLMPENEHHSFIENILSYNPVGFVLGVPRYNFIGNIYVKANFLRGKIPNLLINIIVKLLHYRISFGKLFELEKKLFIFTFSIFEIFTPKKITRLSKQEYFKIFFQHDYELIDSAESGFGSMFGFRKKIPN